MRKLNAWNPTGESQVPSDVAEAWKVQAEIEQEAGIAEAIDIALLPPLSQEEEVQAPLHVVPVVLHSSLLSISYTVCFILLT